uniref:PDZ domain-containing protein n=1 Tax=Globisporangium ultimum (strain ATCC 200006 / CBS 805.95 / DAOM BR144) TaxID=431595 RepID=K3WLB3_GLOUD
MNDPFAMLDPIAKPNGPHVGGGAANYATAPMNYGQQPGLGFSPQQQHNANPFGGAPMMSNNAPMQQQQMYYPSQHNGAAFMTQPGPPSFSGLAPAHQQPMGSATPNPFGFPGQQQQTNPFGPGAFTPMQPQQQMDPFDTHMKTTSMGTTGFLQPQLRPAEPAMRTQPPPVPLTHASSIIMDFDPFSPRDNTPRSPFDAPVPVDQTANVVDQRKRQTQEAQRSQLGFSSDDFAAGGQGSANKISLKALTISGPGAANAAPASQPDAPFFTESDDFMDQNMFANLDDDDNSGAKKDWGHFAKPKTTNGQKGSNNNSETDDNDEMPRECGPNEFDVTFETGRKLGVLMERVDVWGNNRDDKRQEIAVVKLVVENGAADRVGVTIGSSVVAINKRSVARDSYATVLDMIKAAPRPMTIRFKRGTVNKDTTQGNVLTRISNGTFSVGNLTRGNASWTVKYFAFGGAKMDVLQLFVSRAAYHECVISLYEKRPVHTQIQSFRLCRDHKISPIKSKIYKGYGNLHYFSLTVPSLRFVAAKFASEDYETLKNLWSHTYDAIERKKRMGY